MFRGKCEKNVDITINQTKSSSASINRRDTHLIVREPPVFRSDLHRIAEPAPQKRSALIIKDTTRLNPGNKFPMSSKSNDESSLSSIGKVLPAGTEIPTAVRSTPRTAPKDVPRSRQTATLITTPSRFPGIHFPRGTSTTTAGPPMFFIPKPSPFSPGINMLRPPVHLTTFSRQKVVYYDPITEGYQVVAGPCPPISISDAAKGMIRPPADTMQATRINASSDRYSAPPKVPGVSHPSASAHSQSPPVSKPASSNSANSGVFLNKDRPAEGKAPSAIPSAEMPTEDIRYSLQSGCTVFTIPRPDRLPMSVQLSGHLEFADTKGEKPLVLRYIHGTSPQLLRIYNSVLSRTGALFCDKMKSYMNQVPEWPGLLVAYRNGDIHFRFIPTCLSPSVESVHCQFCPDVLVTFLVMTRPHDANTIAIPMSDVIPNSVTACYIAAGYDDLVKKHVSEITSQSLLITVKATKVKVKPPKARRSILMPTKEGDPVQSGKRQDKKCKGEKKENRKHQGGEGCNSAPSIITHNDEYQSVSNKGDGPRDRERVLEHSLQPSPVRNNRKSNSTQLQGALLQPHYEDPGLTVEDKSIQTEAREAPWVPETPGEDAASDNSEIDVATVDGEKGLKPVSTSSPATIRIRRVLSDTELGKPFAAEDAVRSQETEGGDNDSGLSEVIDVVGIDNSTFRVLEKVEKDAPDVGADDNNDGVIVEGLGIRGRSVPIFLSNTHNPVADQIDDAEGVPDECYEEDLIAGDSFAEGETRIIDLTVKGKAIFPRAATTDLDKKERYENMQRKINQLLVVLGESGKMDILRELYTACVPEPLGKQAHAIMRKFIPIVVESNMAVYGELRHGEEGKTQNIRSLQEYQRRVVTALSSSIQTLNNLCIMQKCRSLFGDTDEHLGHIDHSLLSECVLSLLDAINSFGATLQQIVIAGKKETLSENDFAAYLSENDDGQSTNWFVDRNELVLEQSGEDEDQTENHPLGDEGALTPSKLIPDLPSKHVSKPTSIPSVENMSIEESSPERPVTTAELDSQVEKSTSEKRPVPVKAPEEARCSSSVESKPAEATKENRDFDLNKAFTEHQEGQKLTEKTHTAAEKERARSLNERGIFELLDYENRVTRSEIGDYISEEAVALYEAWRNNENTLDGRQNRKNKTSTRRSDSSKNTSPDKFHRKSSESGRRPGDFENPKVILRRTKTGEWVPDNPNPNITKRRSKSSKKSKNMSSSPKKSHKPRLFPPLQHSAEKHKDKGRKSEIRSTGSATDKNSKKENSKCAIKTAEEKTARPVSPIYDPFDFTDDEEEGSQIPLWPPFRNLEYPQSLSLGSPRALRQDLPELFPEPRAKTNNSLSTYGEVLQLPDDLFEKKPSKLDRKSRRKSRKSEASQKVKDAVDDESVRIQKRNVRDLTPGKRRLSDHSKQLGTPPPKQRPQEKTPSPDSFSTVSVKTTPNSDADVDEQKEKKKNKFSKSLFIKATPTLEVIRPMNRRGFQHTDECLDVLNAVFNHPYCEPFRDEVQASEVPDYHKIIKYPMNFSLIASKLRKKHYKEVEPFVKDMRRVFTNCEIYLEKTPKNTNKTKLLRYCKVLSDILNKQLESKFPGMDFSHVTGSPPYKEKANNSCSSRKSPKKIAKLPAGLRELF